MPAQSAGLAGSATPRFTGGFHPEARCRLHSRYVNQVTTTSKQASAITRAGNRLRGPICCASPVKELCGRGPRAGRYW